MPNEAAEAALSLQRGKLAARMSPGSQQQRDYIAAQGKLDTAGKGKAAEVPFRHLQESTQEDDILGSPRASYHSAHQARKSMGLAS